MQTFDEKYASILHKRYDDTDWTAEQLALCETFWPDYFAQQQGLVEVDQTDLDCDDELAAFVEDVEAIVTFEKSLN